MTLEIAIIDEDAAYYASELAQACPGHVFHSGRSVAELLPHCAGVSVLMGLAHGISPELIAATPKLAWIQALTTGVDALAKLKNLPTDVLVTSARGIHGPQMSELAILLMLSLLRDFGKILDNQKRSKWQRWPQKLLLGKTVALVGIGAISEELARRCQAFGMRVIGVSSARTSAPHFDMVLPREELKQAAAEADFLVALVPYTPQTHHMIDGAVLDAMAREAFFINLARGPVADEAALIERLAARSIAGAGLDVFETEPLPGTSPLWRLDNVIVTPHVGGMSDSYADQALPLAIENLTLFAQGQKHKLRNLVRLDA